MVRAGVRATAAAVLDPAIGALQWLRKLAGGQDADKDVDADRRGDRRDRPGGRRDAEDEADAEPPKPKRRVRAFFLYASVLLLGVMGGGALGYNLLEDLLHQQWADIERLQATIKEQSQSVSATQRQLEEAQAARAEAEKTLEAALSEYTKSVAEQHKKLEDAQAARIEAEKKVEASLNDYAKSAGDQQKKLDETLKQLDAMIAAQRPKNGLRSSSSGSTRSARPNKTGNCTVQSGSGSSLKDCIEEFTR